MNALQFSWFILPRLLEGLLVTIKLSVLSLIGGFALGLPLALARVYGGRLPYWVATAYIEVIRGTPVLVQLFIVYFGLKEIGIYFTPFVASVLVFAMNSAAYQAEYFRGAIQTVRVSQIDAALAAGMRKSQAFRYIVFPQMLRVVIPSWSNEFIQLLKLTSMAYVVSLPELTTQARFVGSRYFRFLEPLGMSALLYLFVVNLFLFLLKRVERQLRVPGLGQSGQSTLG